MNSVEILHRILEMASAKALVSNGVIGGDKAIPVNQSEFDPSQLDFCALVLLWGEVFQLTLKVHFRLASARGLAALSLERPAETIDAHAAKDFMREFANLFVGGLRSSFEKEHLLFGVSLPFLVLGTSDLIFRTIKPEGPIHSWKLTHGDETLFLSSEVKILDPGPFQNLSQRLQVMMEGLVPADIETAGDIEFIA